MDLTVNQTGVMLLDPFGQETAVSLTVQYTYGRFARPTGFPFPNKKQPTNINITIEQQPEWCIVSLDRGIFEAPISTFFLKKNQTFNFSGNLTIQCINRSAQALQNSFIRLNVTAEVNGNIEASSLLYDIYVTPIRYLIFDTHLSSSPLITMEYGEEKNTTVTVTNLGNTKTKFRIEPTTPNDAFNVTFDQQPGYEEFILDINEEKQIHINLQSRINDDQNQLQILLFNITSQAAEDSSEQGPSQEVSLRVNLNAQAEKPDDISFEHVDFIVYIAGILIVLPIVLLLIISWRKNIKRRR
jgi:hypothetical protein